jgi:hypothetical protein
MPTNLLNGDARLNHPLFKDENGCFPVIKSRNRLGNIVYQIPNDNAQIVYRILLYEASNQDVDVYQRIITHASDYRLALNTNVRVERRSQTDWSSTAICANGERPRKLVGLRFIVQVPTRGSWGRYVSYSARTASVSNGIITLSSIQRALREATQLLEHHLSHETERQARERAVRVENERASMQASTFMQGIIEHFPLTANESFGWRNNYTQLDVRLILDKHQIGKVFDAIHRIRNFQVNPLDAEYLLKKDY